MSTRPIRRIVAPLALSLVAAGGCGSDAATTVADDAPAETSASTNSVDQNDVDADEQRFPDVIGVEAAYDADAGTWSFSVTISSPYDSAQRYADGWRVIGPDGTVYGTHTLTHDHAGEQPFTRRQAGVEIPADITTVTIEGRDQSNGFGGESIDVELERETG